MTKARKIEAGLAAAALLAGAGVWWAATGGLYGCSAADRRLGPRLVSEQVLPAHPAGLEPVGPPEAGGCDEDDRHVEVRQRYRPSVPMAEAADRYTAEVRRQGWQPQPERPGAGRCYAREAAGTVVFLDFGPSDDGTELVAHLIADPYRGVWC
ncbi:hypothetical protein AB0D08_01665 [Kitasatospora sp. NPDC048540]|uniref:hypothetical protein n=1 Tax=unclassified Kitasatospora TaxID=2633591 RepID=UPI00053B054A|nr:hypothetical protein [Kitasatospora sp. MBT63]